MLCAFLQFYWGEAPRSHPAWPIRSYGSDPRRTFMGIPIRAFNAITPQRSAEAALESNLGKLQSAPLHVRWITKRDGAIKDSERLFEGSLRWACIEDAAAFGHDFHGSAAAKRDHRLAACQRLNHGHTEIFLAGHDKRGRARVQIAKLMFRNLAAELDVATCQAAKASEFRPVAHYLQFAAISGKQAKRIVQALVGHHLGDDQKVVVVESVAKSMHGNRRVDDGRFPAVGFPDAPLSVAAVRHEAVDAGGGRIIPGSQIIGDGREK